MDKGVYRCIQVSTGAYIQVCTGVNVYVYMYSVYVGVLCVSKCVQVLYAGIQTGVYR